MGASLVTRNLPHDGDFPNYDGDQHHQVVRDSSLWGSRASLGHASLRADGTSALFTTIQHPVVLPPRHAAPLTWDDAENLTKAAYLSSTLASTRIHYLSSTHGGLESKNALQGKAWPEVHGVLPKIVSLAVLGGPCSQKTASGTYASDVQAYRTCM